MIGDALPVTVVVTGSLTTKYEVIGDPPLFNGASKVIRADDMIDPFKKLCY